MAGSAFLVTDRTTLWLVTCVHNISGMRETPPIGSIFRNAQIHIVGTPGILPLFVDGKQRFGVVTNEIDGYLVDAIAVRLTPREMAALISFEMFDVGSIVEAEVGDTVTATGFPGLGRTLSEGGLPGEAVEMRSTVERIEGLSILLAEPSVGGLSGAPVVNEDGLIGIMHGDVCGPAEMTNALVVSLDVIADQLLV